MKYRKPEDRVRKTTCPGSMLKPVLAPRLDKHGNRVVEYTGKDENLYAYIQSWADACDLNLLLDRYTRGDETALMQRAGAYLDISDMPDNISDLFNLTEQAKGLFDSLPIQTKEAFGNNVYNFVSNIGSEEWNQIMSVSPEEMRYDRVRAAKELTDRNMKLVDQIHMPIEKEEIVEPVIENPGTSESLKKGLNEL